MEILIFPGCCLDFNRHKRLHENIKTALCVPSLKEGGVLCFILLWLIFSKKNIGI